MYFVSDEQFRCFIIYNHQALFLIPQIGLFKMPFTSISKALFFTLLKTHCLRLLDMLCNIIRKYSYSNNVLKTFEAKEWVKDEIFFLLSWTLTKQSCYAFLMQSKHYYECLVIISNNTASTCLCSFHLDSSRSLLLLYYYRLCLFCGWLLLILP